jgi:hypothetical protein
MVAELPSSRFNLEGSLVPLRKLMGVAVAELRFQGTTRDHVAGQHAVWRLHFLLSVRLVWAGATSIFFLPHAGGALRAPAAAFVAALHHVGGDLRPPL